MPRDTNDETDRVQITVWVDPKRKQRWEDYAEETGINYLSQLIRQSVTEAIHNEHTTQSQPHDNLSSDISELKQSVTRIEETVTGMNTDVQSIRRATSKPAPHVENITNDIYAVLPPYEPGTGEWVNTVYHSDAEKSSFEQLKDKATNQHTPDPTAWGGTPKHIQRTIDQDVSVDDVREACDQLIETTSRVRTKTISMDNTPDPAGLSMGDTVYWKDE